MSRRAFAKISRESVCVVICCTGCFVTAAALFAVSTVVLFSLLMAIILYHHFRFAVSPGPANHASGFSAICSPKRSRVLENHSAKSNGFSRCARSNAHATTIASVVEIDESIGGISRSISSVTPAYTRTASVSSAVTSRGAIRATCPFSIIEAIRSRSARVKSSSCRLASDADIDPARVFFHGHAQQSRRGLAGMHPGFDVVFVAMPGTNDVQPVLVERESSACPVFVDHLGDPRDDLPLADRPAFMRAAILVGVELALKPEDADGHSSHVDDQASAFRHFVARSDKHFLRGGWHRFRP